MLNKVRRVELFEVAVPLAGSGFRNAYGAADTQRSVLLRLTDDEGRNGCGNVDPVPGYSPWSAAELVENLSQRFVDGVLGAGLSAVSDLDTLRERLAAASRDCPDAMAAVEMAALDLLARARGVPAHTLLGTPLRHTMKLNGWIGIVPAGDAAELARGWMARGFDAVKVKVGNDLHADIARVRAVRAAAGDALQIRVDANAAYTVAQSIEFARGVQDCRLQWLEQPVAADDIPALARVRQAVAMPVMADECVVDDDALLQVIDLRAADVVKLKLMKQGGVANTLRLAAAAAEAGLGVVLGHGFGLSLSTAAEVTTAALCPGLVDGLECVGPLKLLDDVAQRPMDLSNGQVSLPPGTGFGIDIDDTRLARLAVSSRAFPA